MYNMNGKKSDPKNQLFNQHAALVKKLAYRLKARLPPVSKWMI